MTETSKHQNKPSKIVFIGGLSISVTKEVLTKYMETFGLVLKAEIQQKGGINRGFGKVTFANLADARQVVEQKHCLGGKEFTCCYYISPEEAKQRMEEEKKRKLFVNGLNAKTTETHLVKYFSAYGAVERAVVNRYLDNTSKGTAFILFDAEETATFLLSSKKYKEHKINETWVTIYQCLSKNEITNHIEKKGRERHEDCEYVPKETHAIESENKKFTGLGLTGGNLQFAPARCSSNRHNFKNQAFPTMSLGRPRVDQGNMASKVIQQSAIEGYLAEEDLSQQINQLLKELEASQLDCKGIDFDSSSSRDDSKEEHNSPKRDFNLRFNVRPFSNRVTGAEKRYLKFFSRPVQPSSSSC